jgi:hypothetical protein
MYENRCEWRYSPYPLMYVALPLLMYQSPPQPNFPLFNSTFPFLSSNRPGQIKSCVLPCHHSCNGPHSPSSTYCYYQKDKDANPGNISKRNIHLEALDVQYFRFAFELGCVMDQAARHRPIIL